jgi:hypothetical protein
MRLRCLYWRTIVTLPVLIAVHGCGDNTPAGLGDDGPDPDLGVALCTPVGVTSGWSFSHLGAGKKPALAIDEGNNLHAAFIDESTDGWVHYVQLPSGSTVAGEPETVADGYLYGPIDLLIAADGQPRVFYHDHTAGDQVMELRSSAGDWSLQPMPNQGHDGWYNTAVLGQDGTIHTATYDPSGFSGLSVNYGAWSGTAWSVELAAPGSFDYAGGMAIAQTADGRVHIAFFDDVAGEIRIASRNGPDDWAVSTVESAGNNLEAGRFSDMVVDRDGASLHLVYLVRSTEDVGMVRYAHGLADALEIRDVTGVTDITIGFSGARDLATLALDASGRPLVSVQTLTRMELLRITDIAATEIASFEAAPGVTFGQHTEIAVDGGGRTHIVWWQSGDPPGAICHAVSG